MILLPTELTIYGDPATVLERKNGFVLIERAPKQSGKHWEVCKIIVAKAGELFGKVYEEDREMLPGKSLWGQYGFSFMSLQAAQEKFNQLTQ
jgi:hypothetical protein